MNRTKIHLNFQQKAKSVDPFYMTLGYANADYTYTEPTQKMYQYLSSFDKGHRYMRVHNILTCHGQGDYYLVEKNQTMGLPPNFYTQGCEEFPDIVVKRAEDGTLYYDWSIVDSVYDTMLAHRLKPIVETVYMPSVLRGGRKDNLPENYKEWREVIYAFVSHLTDRYGEDEIKQWYFEVWNEPDGIPMWSEEESNIDEFLALYDYMVDGVLSVNQAYKVGGPAVKQLESGFHFLPKFLEHCVEGINYATGKRGTRLDFISVHCKAGGIEHGSPATNFYMFNTLKRFWDIISGYPSLRNVEIMNNESDPIWCGDADVEVYSWLNFRNTHYFAGFICKMITMYFAKAVDEWGMNLTVVDSDNCHVQWERKLFSGGRSQFTPLFNYPSTDLICKSVFNAYVLLSHLREKRITATCDIEEPYQHGLNDKYGVLPTYDENSMAILSWYFEDSTEEERIKEKKFVLSFENVPLLGKYNLTEYRIDREHSNAYHAWDRMGQPVSPSKEQIAELRKHEGLEVVKHTCVQLTDNFNIEQTLPAHGVSLLLFTAAGKTSPDPVIPWGIVEERGVNGNRQIFLKWKPAKEEQCFYYRVYRKESGTDTFQLISEEMKVNTAVYTDMDCDEAKKYQYAISVVSFDGLESALTELKNMEE